MTSWKNLFLFHFLFASAPDRKNYNKQAYSCPRDWRLSAITEKNMTPPVTPPTLSRHTIVLRGFRGFHISPRLPRDASLWDSCTPDHYSFSGQKQRQIKNGSFKKWLLKPLNTIVCRDGIGGVSGRCPWLPRAASLTDSYTLVAFFLQWGGSPYERRFVSQNWIFCYHTCQPYCTEVLQGGQCES